MKGFTDIDLGRLPAPGVIEPLDYESIRTAMLQDLVARDPAYTALLKSDPALKVLEVCAYRELLLRQRINEAALAVMLAFAGGSDLDQLGVLVSVARAVVDPGNPLAAPPIAAVVEADDRFRDRIRLAPEGYSTAGPEGAYIFHALTAAPSAKSIAVASPIPDGTVYVTVLARGGDGTPGYREAVTGRPVRLDKAGGTAAVLDGKAIDNLILRDGPGGTPFAAGSDYAFEPVTGTVYRLPGGQIAAGATLAADYHRADVLQLVELALADENVRPLTDVVVVRPAAILHYRVTATVGIAAGPSAALIETEARARLAAYVAARHGLGVRVARSGIEAALHVAGVETVTVTAPAADIVPAADAAPWCDEVALTIAAAE